MIVKNRENKYQNSMTKTSEKKDFTLFLDFIRLNITNANIHIYIKSIFQVKNSKVRPSNTKQVLVIMLVQIKTLKLNHFLSKFI